MPTAACLFCHQTSDAVPLLTLEYRGADIRICAQHLPVLIHDPGQLVGVLEGAENLEPSSHQD